MGLLSHISNALALGLLDQPAVLDIHELWRLQYIYGAVRR